MHAIPPAPPGLPRTRRGGRSHRSAIRRAARRFAREEDGSMVVFGLFVALIIFMSLGLAVDAMNAEYRRTKLQSTLDAAVLAAADLDQPFEAEEVVRSYFEIAGLAHALDPVPAPVESMNSRTVTASASESVATSFLHMVGIDRFGIEVESTANETIPEVEISLVLDVSGSMDKNDRMPRLRSAAREFVDTVIDEDAVPQRVSVSVVPFATQVNAGPRLLRHFEVTAEHDYSHCIDFESGAFDRVAIEHSAADPLQLTGHFEVSSYTRGPDDDDYVCHPGVARRILPWSNDVGELKGYIDDLPVGGNTSIDIGAKWGAALLDPSMRTMVTDHVGEGLVSADFAGRPFGHDIGEVLKVLVVMSDGQNTDQFVLEDGYRSGPTGIWVDERANAPDGNPHNDDYSTHRRVWRSLELRWVDEWYHHDVSIGWKTNSRGQWYYDNGWRDAPDGGRDNSHEMSWTELFDRVSVAWWSRYLRRETNGGNDLDGYYDAYDSVQGWRKDQRTSSICKAARDAGIVVYTISFEAPSDGRATLADCASSSAHYFDVEGVEITEAFRAIASQINQLRLMK